MLEDNSMRKVDEIYPFGINTTIGPTGTIKRLFRNREYFASRGYEMTIFALQQLSGDNSNRAMGLSEIKTLTNQNVSENNATVQKRKSFLAILQSKKHAFVVKNYFASVISHRHSIMLNMKYIKSYISLDRKPDIVVFHEMYSCLHYLKFRKEKRSRVVMFLHADGSDGDMFVKRFPKLEGKKDHRALLRNLGYCYEHCDCIVWISKLARERFCHNHPEYAHKAVAVVNGIDDVECFECVNPLKYKYRMVSTGTVCERKGQYIIVEAMHKMNKEVLKDTHLTIIGSGPDYSRLVALTEEYGLKEHITFAGKVPNKDVPIYLAAENIYVLMSNNEGLPISIIEAMRASLPVISTNVAGIPEQVDERNGVLCNPNVEELTTILNKLPNYDWQVLGIASRKRFEKEFTFETMRLNYANMLDGLFLKK